MKKPLVYCLSFLIIFSMIPVLMGVNTVRADGSTFTVSDGSSNFSVAGSIPTTVAEAGQQVDVELTYTSSNGASITNIVSSISTITSLDANSQNSELGIITITETDFENGYVEIPFSWSELRVEGGETTGDPDQSPSDEPSVTPSVSETVTTTPTVTPSETDATPTPSITETGAVSYTGPQNFDLTGVLKIPFEKDTTEKKDIVVTTTIDKTIVEKDTTVVVAYTITNNSDRDIAVVLSDAEIFEGTMSDTVLAGESKLVHRIPIVITENITSKPEVAYVDESNVDQVAYGDSKEIQIANPQLNLTIKASADKVPYGNDVKIEYTIQNTGNVKFTDVRIFDTKNNELMRISELAANSAPQKRSITANDLTSERTFKFRVTAVNSVTGQGVEIFSNEVKVAVEFTENDARIEIIADSDSSSIDKAEEVNFTIEIINGSAFDMSNIDVYLAMGEERRKIATIAYLGRGASHTEDFAIFVGQTTSFQFIAVAKDKDGEERTFESNPVWVEVKSAVIVGPDAPVVTPTPAPTQKPAEGLKEMVTNNTFFTTIVYIIVILIILLAVSGITYLVLYFKERRSNKKKKYFGE